MLPGFGSCKQVEKTPVFVAVVTLTDRPYSVSNRYVINVLVAFLCCHFAFMTFLWM